MDNFLHRLQQVISRSKRHKTMQGALLLVGTISGTNTSELQSKVAHQIRCEDTVMELPNGRFAVLLENLTHVADPHRVAQRLKLTCPEQIEGIAIVTALAEYENAQSVHSEALKTLSKISVTFPFVYADVVAGEESKARIKLEEELYAAIGAGKLVTYYQPIFNLRSGTITGFEALVRWEHPERGLLLPAEFLEIAELRGYLLKIDELVLKQALTQIAIWNDGSERSIYVSVNLASDHFLKAEVLTQLLTTLNTHPLALNLLRVDVSEQVLLDKGGIDSLKTLDMLRIGFNLDDFGVDSESFHCLGSFPFNSLKIDRTLIHQMEDEVNAELIVAVLRIAKRMGMKTIAEGVVTHAQLEELRNLGCTEAQGFLFSPAVNVQEATELISTEYRW